MLGWPQRRRRWLLLVAAGVLLLAFDGYRTADFQRRLCESERELRRIVIDIVTDSAAETATIDPDVYTGELRDLIELQQERAERKTREYVARLSEPSPACTPSERR